MSLLFVSEISAQKLNINLKEATINGHKLGSYTIDSITDLLGRPTAIGSEYIASIIGQSITYHNLGLQFRFYEKSTDPEQHLHTVYITFIKYWDELYNDFFNPYSEILIPNLNADTKASDIQEIFGNDSLFITTPEEAEKKYNKSVKDTLLYRHGGFRYTILTKFPDHNVNFTHEGVTKFLITLLMEYKK